MSGIDRSPCVDKQSFYAKLPWLTQVIGDFKKVVTVSGEDAPMASSALEKAIGSALQQSGGKRRRKSKKAASTKKASKKVSKKRTSKKKASKKASSKKAPSKKKSRRRRRKSKLIL